MTRSNGTKSQPPGWPVPPHENDPNAQRYAEYDPRTGAAHPDYGHPNYAHDADPAAQPGYNDPADPYFAAGQAQPGSPYHQPAPGHAPNAADPWSRINADSGHPPYAQPGGDAGAYHYPSAPDGADQGYYGGQTPPPYQPAAAPPDPQANYAPQFDPYQQQHYSGEQPGYGQSPAQPDPTQSLSGFPSSNYGRQDDGRAQIPPQPELRGGNFDHAPAASPYDAGGQGAAWPEVNPHAYAAPEPPQPSMTLRHDGGQVPHYDEDPYQADRLGAPPFAAHYDGGQGSSIAPQGNEYENEYEYDEDDTEQDYEGGSGRKFVILAALVGSIAVGGGVAYGYNKLFSVPSGGDGQAPVVKADGGPARVQPSDPGGRKFSHTDSGVLKKMAKRAPAAAGTTPDGQGETSEGGDRVKVVTTMTFDRQGRMVVSKEPQPVGTPQQPAGTQRPAPTRSPPPSSSGDQPLPGLTIMNGNAFGQPPSQTQAAPSTLPQQGTPPADLRPKVVAETTKRVPPAVAPRTTRSSRRNGPPLPTRAPSTLGAGSAAPPQQRTATAIVRPVRPQINTVRPITPAPRATPPVRTAPAVAATNGYVAVLATKRSRIDALKSFADLQQKYARVLGRTIPAVQVADLRSRGMGTMYRAVVGPPGSRQAAQKVCSQLRSAGYRSCWVKAY